MSETEVAVPMSKTFFAIAVLLLGSTAAPAGLAAENDPSPFSPGQTSPFGADMALAGKQSSESEHDNEINKSDWITATFQFVSEDKAGKFAKISKAIAENKTVMSLIQDGTIKNVYDCLPELRIDCHKALMNSYTGNKNFEYLYRMVFEPDSPQLAHKLYMDAQRNGFKLFSFEELTAAASSGIKTHPLAAWDVSKDTDCDYSRTVWSAEIEGTDSRVFLKFMKGFTATDWDVIFEGTWNKRFEWIIEGNVACAGTNAFACRLSMPTNSNTNDSVDVYLEGIDLDDDDQWDWVIFAGLHSELWGQGGAKLVWQNGYRPEEAIITLPNKFVKHHCTSVNPLFPSPGEFDFDPMGIETFQNWRTVYYRNSDESSRFCAAETYDTNGTVFRFVFYEKDRFFIELYNHDVDLFPKTKEIRISTDASNLLLNIDNRENGVYYDFKDPVQFDSIEKILSDGSIINLYTDDADLVTKFSLKGSRAALQSFRFCTNGDYFGDGLSISK